MRSLALALEHLYPEADPLADYLVADDGSGPYIEHWDEAKLGPRPTEAQLRDAWLPALKAQKRRELEAAFDAETRRDFPSAYLLVAVFVTDARDARIAALKARLAKLRDLQGRVEAAKTEAEVRAVLW